MLPLIILWIVIISAFTLFGSWYARRYDRSDALFGLYVAFGIFANIAATKTAAFDLWFSTFYAPAVILIFGVTFLITDIVNERFGLAETRRMILIALLSQVVISFFAWLVLALPVAPFYMDQASLESVLGQVPRIVFASWVAFLVSENLDAYIFSWFKARTGGRHLWARNAFSSLPAMVLDSTIFISLAFYGVMPIMPLIVGITVTKWLVGLVDIPFMYLNRWVMYR
ncbi:MAG: queuosine precursor transporter [Methanotrichaceae archaeon]|nr:queuosine precursor transporter [Methanotrichaceae archaeon]